MKVTMVFGTRPEIIKCHSTYKALKNRLHEVCVYWTNQNFDPTLSDIIFDEFPYDTEDMTRGRDGSDVVLVQGDTWSVLEGALIAGELKVPLGHIEAGIRSYDQRMVEERIRVLVDRYSKFHFAPTQIAVNNLKKELGVKADLVGNTIADLMVNESSEKPEHITVTLHRPETVDNQKTLKETIDGITLVSSYYRVPVRFFCHPRTQDRIKSFGMSVEFEPSVGREEFLGYLKNSLLIITDSGGVQEEAAILRIPCVTARISTERPETLEAGLNVLGGNTMGGIFDAARVIINNFKNGDFSDKPLYGDGHAGEKIVKILEERL